MVGRTTKNSLRAMADESAQIGASHSGDGVDPHKDEIGDASPVDAYVEPRVIIVGEETSAFWCRVERKAVEARVQDMSMEHTIKFVALNRTEDAEIKKDISKLDLDSKSLQHVN